MLFSLLQDDYEESKDNGMQKIDILVDEVYKSNGFIEYEQHDKEVVDEGIYGKLDEQLLVEVYGKVIV
jgi:hypothetical protein